MLEDIRVILRDTLQLGDRAGALRKDTRLLGNLAELDSMAVVSVISALEERFGFTVEDDDISAETFETMDSLCSYVERRLANG